MSTSLEAGAATRAHVPARLAPAWTAVVIGVAALAYSTNALLAGREPFATWYYQFAWYSVLLAGDGVIALMGAMGRRGDFLLLGKPKYLVSLLFWSAIVWYFYELLNFRLVNWYYINLPPNLGERWIATTVAFATVLPAVFVSEKILDGLRIAHNTRWKALRINARFLRNMQLIGAAMMALVLAWPQYFFPLVWGASMLIVEPTVYRRARERSLLADLERGEPGRLLRLLLGGAAIGLIWESLNIRARTKWIYTVPGLEDVKLFEMPVLGFFGFPPFAVECFILWQAIVTAGLAAPRTTTAFPATLQRRVAGVFVAIVFCVGVLGVMERLTFTSTRPPLSAVPQVPVVALEREGFDVFKLAASDARTIAAQLEVASDQAQAWVDAARLIALRGIGTDNAALLRQAGITNVHELAAQDPEQLVTTLERIAGEDLVDARIRVWIRGARRVTAGARAAP